MRVFKSLNQGFWEFYERFYEWLFRIEPVGPPGEGALRWGLTHYRGPGIELEGGIKIRKGEVVGELHTDNRMIKKLGGFYQSVPHALWTSRLAPRECRP